MNSSKKGILINSVFVRACEYARKYLCVCVCVWLGVCERDFALYRYMKLKDIVNFLSDLHSIFDGSNH